MEWYINCKDFNLLGRTQYSLVSDGNEIKMTERNETNGKRKFY